MRASRRPASSRPRTDVVCPSPGPMTPFFKHIYRDGLPGRTPLLIFAEDKTKRLYRLQSQRALLPHTTHRHPQAPYPHLQSCLKYGFTAGDIFGHGDFRRNLVFVLVRKVMTTFFTSFRDESWTGRVRVCVVSPDIEHVPGTESVCPHRCLK